MVTKQVTGMQAAMAKEKRLLALYKKSRVLIIEDGAEARGTLRSFMRDAGVEKMDLVVSGQQAIESLRSHQYDIVFCDYNLGKGKDGQQVLEEAKFSNYISNSTIFIMVTAETTIEMVLGALEYQPDGYLSKPYTQQELMVRLNRAVERKIEYREIEYYFQQKQYLKTIKLCDEKIVAQRERPMRAYRIKGECLIDQEQYDEAKSLCLAILLDREVPWAKIGLGRCLFFLKEYKSAAKVFKELTTEQPNVIESYDWLARIQLAQDDSREAQITLQEATLRSPKAVLRQMELARVAMLNRSYMIAEKAYRKTIVLANNSCYNSPDNYLRYIRMLLIKIDQSKSTESRDAFQEALLFLSRLRKEYSKDPDSNFKACTLEALVRHQYGRSKECADAMQMAESLYSSFEKEKKIKWATEEYITTLTLIDRIADGETFIENIRSTWNEPELLEKLLVRVRDGQRRMSGEKLNREATEFYERGHIVEAYGKFSEAASTTGASVNVLMNAVKICIELAEKQDLNQEEWRKECAAYLDRLSVMDRYDHRYETLLSYRDRFQLL